MDHQAAGAISGYSNGMTFQDGGNFDSNRVQKRGRSRGAKAATGGGLGVLALVILSQVFNVDLTPFASLLDGGSNQTSSYQEADLEGCDTADLANSNDECRYGWTLESLDAYWARTLPVQTGVKYTLPPAVSFTDSVDTACGGATSATGPFYCPADETVYIDVSFYEILRSEFDTSAGSLAQMYIIAHEVGHHIENQTGILGAAKRQDSGANSDSVKIELMADCLAGMWAGGAAAENNPATGRPDLEPITKAQLADALDAAAAVGDDRIQEAQTGKVSPHSFTHGTAAQRQKWFTTGYTGGDFNACNTFEAKSLG